ncbi:hypothetical protein LLG95_09540 [bacterium]|nr:hypothetical protein [bacterium]
MLFHTYPFIIFLAIVLPLFYLLRKTKLWLPFLLASSYVFYGMLNPWFLLLVLYITLLNYAIGIVMSRLPFDPEPGAPFYRKQIFWLWLGVFADIWPLAFFKYARFFNENLNAVFGWVHIPFRLPDPSVIMPFGIPYLLPAGISFFTFQALSYLIDLYLGKIERERNLLRFANFVCFFPNVLMGPIERAGHMLPQFERPAAFRLKNFTDGLSLFLIGLFKKLALASYLQIFVDRVYDNPGDCGAPELILATIAFGWQIYFDFSGYSDMARGVARLFGFNLVLNFNNPYLATGIGDFWRRWHMSFSRWILDYIFMPLQLMWRNWPSWGTAAALVVTFLFSGVWHVAGVFWTYIVWGLLHGFGLAATNQLERSKYYRKNVPTWIKRAGTFAFVSFAWIFFRAHTIDDALLIVKRIFIAPWSNPHIAGLIIAIIILAWIYQILHETRWRETLARTSWAWSAALAVLLVVILCFSSSGSGAFIYLQF